METLAGAGHGRGYDDLRQLVRNQGIPLAAGCDGYLDCLGDSLQRHCLS